MTIPQFIDLVRQMRQAQRDYFRRRSADALEQSKRLEREVDQALDQMAAPPTLFERRSDEEAVR